MYFPAAPFLLYQDSLIGVKGQQWQAAAHVPLTPPNQPGTTELKALGRLDKMQLLLTSL